MTCIGPAQPMLFCDGCVHQRTAWPWLPGSDVEVKENRSQTTMGGGKLGCYIRFLGAWLCIGYSKT